MKNTEENAEMTLASRQTADGETIKQEFVTNCGFYKNGNAYHLTYKEHADMGMGESRVFLKALDGIVTIRRMGEFKSVMSYEEGKITDSIYRVPFGQMELKIKTSRITNELTENGGSLKMRYSLFLGGECIENEVDISVTTQERKIL